MKYLKIEVRRDAYSPSEIGNTLTVGELISILENYDEGMPVIMSHDSDYSYGGIVADNIDTDEDESEDLE